MPAHYAGSASSARARRYWTNDRAGPMLLAHSDPNISRPGGDHGRGIAEASSAHWGRRLCSPAWRRPSPRIRAKRNSERVHFSTSCNEAAQRRFDRAMRYQHSFWYRQSKEVFEEVLAADPECAMAHWGVALSLLFNPHIAAARAKSRPGPGGAAEGEVAARSRRSASATTSTRCSLSTPATTRSGMASACRPTSTRWKRWRNAIPTTTRPRSPMRSRSTSPPRPTTRPMRTSSRARRSWSRSSSASRATRASRIISSTSTTIRRSPRRGSTPPSAMPRSRPPRRTPSTCRRTSSRASAIGRNRSRPTRRRRAPRRPARRGPTSCTRWTTWSMPIFSSRRTRRRARSSTRCSRSRASIRRCAAASMRSPPARPAT